MKKILATVLALVMVLAMAGCNSNKNEETTPATTTAPAVQLPESALAILEAAWGNYAEDEKFFVMGGNPENAVDGAPGNYNMEYAENLTYNLIVPAESVAQVKEAATMIHAMNANTFTSGVIRVVEGADASAFATTMRDAIQGNQWMCGFPETLYIATLGDYVVIAFGLNDAMTPFLQHVVEACPDLTVAYNEAIG